MVSPIGMPKSRSRAARLLAALMTLAVFGALLGPVSGCGAILNNDPSLRWWAFKTFGAQRVCPEMLKTSVPLRMSDGAPVVGRYYPNSCTYSINDQNRTLLVNIGGSGYAYYPTLKRLGFNLTVSVEYAFDYRFEDEGVWGWGKLHRVAAGPDFQLTYVENAVVDIATVITPAGPAANMVGGQVVSSFLQRGFTVIETDQGKEFSLGILPPGVFPKKPIEIDSEDESLTFANETTEVRAGGRDFLGPFEVADDDQVIQMKGTLSGDAVDLLVFPKQMGDGFRESYQRGDRGGPQVQPVMAVQLTPGPFTKRFKLRPGLYTIVVDHTATAGATSPALALPNLLADPFVHLTYVAQLIEP